MTNLTDPIFHDADAARNHLEKVLWPDGPTCPHCGAFENIAPVKGKKQSHRPGLYYCNACKGQFTVTVGTIYERSKIPLNKWLLATHLMCASKKGVSAHQLHRTLGISYKAAWFMAHRIREGMKPTKDDGPLGGSGKHVEADETYIGTPSKHYRHTFKSGEGWKKTRTPNSEKSKIVALVERGGKVRTFKVDNVTVKELRHVIFTNVDRASELQTDEAMWYKEIGTEFTKHHTVKHTAYEYVRGDATTNTVEGYFGVFKRGMKGVYQHCGEQHLHRYLCEFDFRYNNRTKLGVNDNARTLAALRGIVGRRLTYQQAGEASDNKAAGSKAVEAAHRSA